MDASLQPLIQCFDQTLSPDQNIRKRAELELRNVERNPGFIGAILTVVSQSDNPGVKQAGAVYLKNCVSRRWNTDSDQTEAISEQEKHECRERLVPIIVSASLSTRAQLTNVLNQILGADYPDRWPSFLESTLALLRSHDVTAVYAGLICLLELARVYRWRSKDRRKGLDAIVNATFGTLLQIGDGLLLEDNELAADMMRIVLKIYKSVIWLELSADLQNMSSLVPWGQLLLKTITKEVPLAAMPDDLEARETHMWWKAKKWAYFCLDRLFQRYGDPTQLRGEAAQDYSEFAKLFSKSFAPEILRCYLSQVQNWAADSNKHWLSSRALYFIGSFLTSCVKPKVTWVLLKDNVDSLVEHFVFPQICQTEADLELWETDPQEYISKRIDIYDDYEAPDVAAANFLVACCSRKKSSCFMQTLAFANRELSTYIEAASPQKNPIRKEGALRMVGNLAHLILRDGCPVRSMMEQFFISHVFPEFDSPHPYLRARACEMMNRFADIEYQNQDSLAIAYQGVMKCLVEKELPVRVEAALALQPLIRQDFIHNAMVESIPQIMKVMLQLANEVDIDSLSNVMEEYVEVFANELTPYAVELAEQLRDTFMRIMSDSLGEQNKLAEDDEHGWDSVNDKSLAALGILNTIGTLILSLENTPEALFKLEETVLPVISFVLENEYIDLYAEVFEIIDSCTFSAKAISPIMWNVFVVLHQTFQLTGMDYIDELLPSLENYITYGATTLATNVDHQARIFSIIESVFENDRLGVQDRLAATKLAQMFLLNLHGQIDQYLHPLMTLVMKRLSNPRELKVGSYKVLLIETLVNAIYYNPQAALQFLEANGGASVFFNLWLTSLSGFVRVHDKKLVILTIIALLNLPSDQIPKSISEGWLQLPQAMITVFTTYPEALAKREEAQKKLTSEDSSYWKNETDYDYDEDDAEDEADEEEWDDNEQSGGADGDAPKSEGDQYIDFLSQEASRLNRESAARGSDGDDGDEYDDEAMSEDVLFTSPLEHIDAYIAAKSFFQNLHETNLAFYERLTSIWSPEMQQQFSSVMRIAAQSEATQAARQAAQ